MINTKKGIAVFNEATNMIMSPPKGVRLEQWPEFTNLIGGLRPNELTIFCGATGAGKTQWLSNIACQLVVQGEKVFVAPVETGYVDFAVRMLSILNKKDLNTGDAFHPREITPAIEEHFEKLNDNVIFSTHDNRVDVLEMVQTLKYMADVEKVKVAVLDNLNFFMKPAGANNIILEYDEAIHQFVMLAKEVPLHIFLVMHPKKSESGKLKSEFDIKGSSTAVQEASNVLLFNRLDEDEVGTAIGNAFTRELVFKKLRKRGFNINKKLHMHFRGAGYVES